MKAPSRYTLPVPLSTVLCVNCNAAGLTLLKEGQAQCRYCNTLNTFGEPICAECETLNAPKVEVCVVCRTPLRRACPACNESNWNGYDHCQKCDRSLDMLNNLIARGEQHNAGRQGYTPAEANAIKTQEEADSQKRLAYFREIERRRQDDLRVAKSRKAREEQMMLYIFLALLVLIIGAVVVVMLLNQGR